MNPLHDLFISDAWGVIVRVVLVCGIVYGLILKLQASQRKKRYLQRP